MKIEKIRIIFLCSAIVSALVLLSCGIVFGVNYVRRSHAEESYQELEEDFVAQKPQEEQKEQSDKPQLPPEYYFIVDFDALQKVNPDIYAWIKIPGTKISYPVLQHAEDNTFYLEHTVKKRKGLPGSIYSENMNPKDFSDFVHILYGHNMNNDTMFATLHRYEEEGFLEKYPYIYVYTRKQLSVYQIFATVQADNRHIITEYNNFETDEDKKAFIKYVTGLAKNKNAKNHYLEGSEVTPQDKLLTLSTCVGGNKQRRYLVNAVLKEVVPYTDYVEIEKEEATREEEKKEEPAPQEAPKEETPQQGSTESVWDQVLKEKDKIQIIDKVPQENQTGAGKVQ